MLRTTSCQSLYPGAIWLDAWPATGQPIFHDLSYYIHQEGHSIVSSDWSIYLAFSRRFSIRTSEQPGE